MLDHALNPDWADDAVDHEPNTDPGAHLVSVAGRLVVWHLSYDRGAPAGSLRWGFSSVSPSSGYGPFVEHRFVFSAGARWNRRGFVLYSDRE